MDKDLNGQNREREESLPETAGNAAAANTTENPRNNGGDGKGRKPLEKKTLIRIISISAAAVVAAVALILGLVLGLKGCKSEFTVTLTETEHIFYNYSAADGEKVGVASAEVAVAKGELFSFTLTVDEGYTQLPTVTAGEQKVNPVDGVYSFVVTEDVTVTVKDVVEVSYALEGSGTQEAPYAVSGVKDLNFMAEQINLGNTSYVQAYYKLANDIDVGGGKLTVIGDGSTQNSFFGGFFDGNGHTISNYVIETNGVDYVGLFGFVQASPEGGVLGTIQNLNLKDFSITAFAASGKNVTAGSFFGFGIAATLKNCSAVNGSINVFGNTFFCYVGGAVGIQQSAVVTSGGSLNPFYAIVEGVHTDVYIYNGSGYTFAAGGIAGMLYSDYDTAPSTVTNCYAEGGVYGAMRAGGIVGYVNNYSAINNVYSTGEIAARSDMKNLNAEFAAEYGAYAGGIAGYCGYGTLIANSFSTASVRADKQSEIAVAVTGDIAAYAQAETVNGYGAVIYNCKSGAEAQGTSANFVKNTLKWNVAQWNVADGALPTLTGAEASGYSLKLDYSGKKVDGTTEKAYSIKADDGKFRALCEAYRSVEGLTETLVTDDGLASYGFYFDSELKFRVPYGFVPAGETTLYTAFADYGEVAGAYYYNRNDRIIRLTLEDDGVYTYEDGVGYISAYTYDGSRIIFADGLFARLSDVVTGDGVSANFSAHRYFGTKTQNSLELYDGVYFTEENPLVLTAEAPVVTTDAFKGKWEKSATINEIYEFDGNGKWSYEFGTTTRSGDYTVNADGAAVMTLSGGAAYGVAKIDASGLLSLTPEGQTEAKLYCLDGSMFGIWFDGDSGNYVRFEGYGLSLTGDVVASLDGTPYALKYIKDNYCIDDGDGVCFTIMNDMSYFGYLIYIEKDKTLTGELFAQASGGYERHTFYLVDNYVGEWIGDGAINGVDFTLVNFNGFGSYEVEDGYGLTQKLGYIEINGERVPYTVDLNDSLKGKFTYNGIEYTLSYDESGVVTISGTSGTATLERKDGLYEYSFIDADNNVYSFNGGGNLSGGGILTVTDEKSAVIAEYGYKMTGNLFPDKNVNVTLTDRESGAEVGYMRVSGNKMLFALNRQRAESLDLNTPFTGVWAIAGILGNFSIGNFDLSLTARGGFRDMPTATYKLDIANNYASVTYMTSESMTAYNMYILYLEDGNLALSSQPYLIAGDYFYASRQDEVFGYWQNTENAGRTLSFDGLADSKYTYGVAYDSGTRITYNYTRRFGKIYLWNVNDDTQVSVLEPVDYQKTGENVFKGTTRVAYELLSFDADLTAVCVAADGDTEYKFFFDGSLERDGVSGTYELVVMSGDVTRLVMYFAGEDAVTADVNHKNGTVAIIG